VTLLVEPSALPEPSATINVPPFTVVEPLYVFAAVNVSVPAPFFCTAMSPCDPLFVPEITPAKVVEMPATGLTVRVLVPPTTLFLTVPLLSPVSEATESL